MAYRLKNLLISALNRAGIKQQITATQIIKECRKIIRNIWGEQSLERISPKYIKRGLITIQIKDAIYLTELKLKEKEIIKELNNKFKKTTIEGLRFLIN